MMLQISKRPLPEKIFLPLLGRSHLGFIQSFKITIPLLTVLFFNIDSLLIDLLPCQNKTFPVGYALIFYAGSQQYEVKT